MTFSRDGDLFQPSATASRGSLHREPTSSVRFRGQKNRGAGTVIRRSTSSQYEAELSQGHTGSGGLCEGKAGLARLEFTEKMQHFPRGLHKTSAPHTLLHHSAPTNRVSVELPLEGIFAGVEASTPLPGSA